MWKVALLPHHTLHPSPNFLSCILSATNSHLHLSNPISHLGSPNLLLLPHFSAPFSYSLLSPFSPLSLLPPLLYPPLPSPVFFLLPSSSFSRLLYMSPFSCLPSHPLSLFPLLPLSSLPSPFSPSTFFLLSLLSSLFSLLSYLLSCLQSPISSLPSPVSSLQPPLTPLLLKCHWLELDGQDGRWEYPSGGGADVDR